MTFTVNRDLLGRISNDEDSLYDRYTVKYHGSELSDAFVRERTGTIPDLLAYLLPDDVILEVTRA